MYESPYIQGCMYVIIICWILGNMYGSITLDIGAYLSYILHSCISVCVCLLIFFTFSYKKASTESNRVISIQVTHISSGRVGVNW